MPSSLSPNQLPGSPSGEVIDAILAERDRFQRFLAARVVSPAEVEDLLQQSLLKALESGGDVRRGEKAVSWFYRILRNAVVDHYRNRASELRRVDHLWNELRASGEDVVEPPAKWDAAVCACFRGLLPALKPRYAELIRRIDLDGESKAAVAQELKIKRATLDVVLHRARAALRQQLEVFCGACSRERCGECFCAKEKV